MTRVSMADLHLRAPVYAVPPAIHFLDRADDPALFAHLTEEDLAKWTPS